MALTDKLSAIGDAIREKTGSTELMTLDAMPIAIASITTGGGGGGDLPEEALTITGNCEYRFCNNGWNWFLNGYKDQIKMQDIINASSMFRSNTMLTKIPYAINFSLGSSVPAGNLFYDCIQVEEIGPINNLSPSSMAYMFYNCCRLQYLPEFNNFSNVYIKNDPYVNLCNAFAYCLSLRSIPEELLKQIYSAATSTSYPLANSGFLNCYALDEIRGLRPSNAAALSSNIFRSTFNACSHLKSIIFDTQADGTPYVAKWSNQIIDLTYYVGYASSADCMINYNSGLKAEDEITSSSELERDGLRRAYLIEGDDWWTCDVNYSRYNRESAIATFNSLPDCSSGSSNTIKLKKNQASKWCRPVYRPGSTMISGSEPLSLSALTEEEIAIAAAKGWTVTFVD